MNTIEIFGLCAGTLSIALLIKQNIWTWPIGIAYTLASLYIFFTAKLYADFALHVFFLFMSFYGWYYWLQGNSRFDSELRKIADEEQRKRQKELARQQARFCYCKHDVQYRGF